MFEGIVLGIIQGIAEWLPVSSEGFIVLAKVHFFGGDNIEEIIKGALLLHLGTVLAAVVYLRKELMMVIKTLFHYKRASSDQQHILQFLIVATLISGIIGFVLLKAVTQIEFDISQLSRVVTMIIAGLLVVTGFLQLKAARSGRRQGKDLRTVDAWWLGLAQGFAALPGLSRSGLTVATFLLRNFDKTSALKLSFLMSIPIVFAGNIILNYNVAVFTPEMWWGLLASFIFGLITIDILIRVARKVNFGYFVLVFAALTFIAVFI